MSRKVCVQFEVRDMLIMKDTLAQMGIKFNEIDQERIEIQRSYHPIAINSKTGEISYDEMHGSDVNRIKQEYTVNFYKDKCIREGNQLKEERKANGEIVLHITHS
jgi:hypothetical protein